MEGNEGARFGEREGNEWPINLLVLTIRKMLVTRILMIDRDLLQIIKKFSVTF